MTRWQYNSRPSRILTKCNAFGTKLLTLRGVSVNDVEFASRIRRIRPNDDQFVMSLQNGEYRDIGRMGVFPMQKEFFDGVQEYAPKITHCRLCQTTDPQGNDIYDVTNELFWEDCSWDRLEVFELFGAVEPPSCDLPERGTMKPRVVKMSAIGEARDFIGTLTDDIKIIECHGHFATSRRCPALTFVLNERRASVERPTEIPKE